MAVLCFAASVLCCLLPETKDTPTLEVMDSVNSNSSAEAVENASEKEEGNIKNAIDTNL